jgi:hypothetical protein
MLVTLRVRDVVMSLVMIMVETLRAKIVMTVDVVEEVVVVTIANVALHAGVVVQLHQVPMVAERSGSVMMRPLEKATSKV